MAEGAPFGKVRWNMDKPLDQLTKKNMRLGS